MGSTLADLRHKLVMAYSPSLTLPSVDADFVGGWSQANANSADNTMSCKGYVIMCAGCPILRSSKLQTEIALSTAETEYITLD